MSLKTCVLVIGRLDTFENCYDTFKKYIIRNYDDSVRKQVHPNDEKFTRKRSEITPNTWLSSLYNLKLANQLKKEYENEHQFKYDICIKSRTECIWHTHITKDEIKLVKENKKNIFIPTAWDFKSVHPLGCSDVSCVTSSEGMNMYSSCIDFIDSYYDSGEIFHPESFLGIHLNNIGLNRIPITTGIDPFTKEANQSGWCVVDPNRVKTQY